MKKSTLRNAGGLLCCLALTALVSCGLYYANSSVRSAIDGGIQTSADKPVVASNEDGTLKILLPSGPKFSASVGDTLKLIATLSPADVTDKRVSWSSGDASKVAFDTATTVSGGSAVARLVKLYSGSVTVTATAVSNPAVKLSVLLWCPNELDANAGPSFEALWANSVSSTVLNADLVDGSGSSYACVKTGPRVDASSTNHVFTLSDVGIGSSASVGISLCWSGLDTSRYPTVFDSWGISGNSWQSVSDKSLLTYKKSVQGVESEISKDTVAVSARLESNGVVGVRFAFSGTFAGCDQTILYFLDSSIVVYNTSAYVAPAGIAGTTSQTF